MQLLQPTAEVEEQPGKGCAIQLLPWTGSRASGLEIPTALHVIDSLKCAEGRFQAESESARGLERT